MKISHECQLQLLGNIKNDYEYALLHLMHIPEYRKYIKETKKEVILDNSAYEYQFIEGGFDEEYFLEVIKDIKPDVIIVPDVIGDCNETIEKFKKFDIMNLPENTKIMGVVQGSTYEELYKCFDFLNSRCNYVAIPFHSQAYIEKFNKNSPDEANSIGRVHFIRKLINGHKSKSIRKNSLHLIGMSLPIELELYSEEEKSYIRTIDTANPIQWGSLGVVYPKDLEHIREKPKYLMIEENLKENLNDFQIKAISYNIDRFRELINGRIEE